MRTRKSNCRLLAFVLLLLGLTPLQTSAQSVAPLAPSEVRTSDFRVELTRIDGGAELLTIWANLVDEKHQFESRQVPLVTVLRDTLGDRQKENDKLRQVWVHTYVNPTLVQKAAASVPFLYSRFSNKSPSSSTDAPPPVLDLSKAEQKAWSRAFSSLLRHFGVRRPLLRLCTHTYQRNADNYRNENMYRAVTVLSLYRSKTKEPLLTDTEMAELESRLVLDQKTFGGLVAHFQLQKFRSRQTDHQKGVRGHNWELLRQQAESSGLYFQPLFMPDGSASHALLWIAKSDLQQEPVPRYDGRFLNIKNPWTDKRLSAWRGFSMKSAQNHSSSATTPPAVEMIPLAVYGLDFPKIPALLIDFRDRLNPTKRELSRRVLDEVAGDIFSLSPLGSVYYLAGRTTIDFISHRRGIDFNQPSRLRSYAQLKLFLSFDNEISPALRAELAQRVQKLSTNPLENDWEHDNERALNDYEALMAYSRRAGGLPEEIKKARREEMTKFVHNDVEQTLFRIANILTLGRYSHREKMTSDLVAQLDRRRKMNYHTQFLRKVVRSTPLVEVAFDMSDVIRSLRYIAQNGELADTSTVEVLKQAFNKTEVFEARVLCLRGLGTIATVAAKKELQRINDDEQLAGEWRELAADQLRVPSPPHKNLTAVP